MHARSCNARFVAHERLGTLALSKPATCIRLEVRLEAAGQVPRRRQADAAPL